MAAGVEGRPAAADTAAEAAEGAAARVAVLAAAAAGVDWCVRAAAAVNRGTGMGVGTGAWEV